MKLLKLPLIWSWLAALCIAGAGAGEAQVVISEILFNPPNVDTPHEYIELRALPSYVLPEGTFFVAVEGDFSENTNPGVIQNVIDLSGRKFGTNGHMVLLQKSHLYAANPSGAPLVNTGSGPGWGSGPSSSIGHTGEGDKTELDNASVTFFLIQTRFMPEPDRDIDSNNDGQPDGPYSTWTVLDAVGILDATGPGDFAYGLINFRRNTPPGNQAGALGVIVSVGFTATYVGRTGNTTGSNAADWVACNNLAGTAPNWTLPPETAPSSFATRPLNHIGARNFLAPALRGLIITPSGTDTAVAEGGGTDSYTVGLNALPATNANVVVQVTAPAPLRIGTDAGLSFFTERTLTFNSITPQTIFVRALDDNLVDMATYLREIRHEIISTGDPANFPQSLVLAPAPVHVTENDFLVLNEIKVNPPGNNDAPHEFVEILGAPGASLTNVQFIALESDDGGDPGTVEFSINLTSQQLGANGLLLLAAPGHGYGTPPGTTVVSVPAFGAAGGVLGNGSASFLLLSARGNITAGSDLDRGDNGVLEGLPIGATLLDAVGWRDGNTNDVMYGGVMLVDGDTPDAAARFPGNNTPSSAGAWFFGSLEGDDSDALIFDPEEVSSNFPVGTTLSPGDSNPVTAYFMPVEPIAGAIGDPTNPKAFFGLSGFASPPTIAITSTNQSVVPDANLALTSLGGGRYSLSLTPVGIGYSLINLTATDGATTARLSFRYAASEQGDSDTRYHTFASDASTAIPIDSNYMFVGDDENQIIRIYHRKQTGGPMAEFDITPHLGLTDLENGRPREVDVEGSTRVGNRIYWIGAHSHANIAEARTNRSRIFTTDVSGSGLASTLAYVGRYDYLKLDLVNWDNNNGHGKGAYYYGLVDSTAEGVDPKAPDGSGFNIEALAIGPSNAGYIGFRAPLVPAATRTHALIVPILNFNALATGTGPAGSAVFGAPIELDLYGRGIRSIEAVGGSYLIVAGIPGDFIGAYPKDFRLYSWTGNPADKPQERAADLTGLNPEGIIELPTLPWTAASLVHLMSDSGRKVWYNDDITAKEMRVLPFKKFRTDIVSLGSIVKTVPYVVSTDYRSSQFTIRWRSIAGERYRVEYKTSLSQTTWTPLGADVLATGPYASKTDTNPQSPQRFYHVVILP